MKNRFTVQLNINVDADSFDSLQQAILAKLGEFPKAKIIQSNITVWQDMNGNPRKYDDDGKEIIEGQPELIPEVIDEAQEEAEQPAMAEPEKIEIEEVV